MTKTVYIVYEYHLNSSVTPRRFRAFFDKKKAIKYWEAENSLFGQTGGRIGDFLTLQIRESPKKKRPRGGTGRRNGD
jgi:hypothetical protein